MPARKSQKSSFFWTQCISTVTMQLIKPFLQNDHNHESCNETWNTMCMAWHGLEKHGSMLTSKVTQKQNHITSLCAMLTLYTTVAIL